MSNVDEEGIGEEREMINYIPFSGISSGPRLDDWILQGEWNEHIVKSERFIEFMPRPNFQFDRSITWFPSHMSRGKLKMAQRIDTINCIIEVRDSRVPLSSSNPEIYRQFPPKIPRLIVLNKADLVPKNDLKRTLDLFEKANLKVLHTDATKNRHVGKIVDFCKINCNIKFASIGIAMLLIGLPNVGKSSLITSMKRYVQNIAKYADRRNRITEGVKNTLPRSCHVPGTSKHLNMFQLSSNPKIFCFDTPGIMTPKSDDLELNLKLASLGSIQENYQDILYISDYVLYWLNKHQHFSYVDHFHLSYPTNSIRHVASAASKIANMVKRDEFVGDEIAGANLFLKLFRNGTLGKFTMDILPDPKQLIKRSQIEAIAECPGPWGPSEYDLPLRGLE
ncbi:Mitochondrial ribosome-associated GTPase 1 [Babesia microti strain RI]|uniref:Mitochondrial ribosome-associated GTPase 1 n=1 Tax=Babesia microti (strain RI) TaxID=1133968 RepID=A0A1N6LXX6_BABMR|nr:Mitochondrial ribosome-associated GTPase 1 [Babesia microti strain RI]SIO73721.1 Mitochondrial ribosome-associated GTPase 1 [Babesia microti strain RI]|eukprot:XP_021337787.1 Mitochondrial ribosome-associated GTPase 1 [Babesia microti strain RI]